MLEHPRCIFLDLDHTLYDTALMMASVQQDMQNLGADLHEIQRTQEKLNGDGYSFERHLILLGFPEAVVAERVPVYKNLLRNGDQFLFPGVREGMEKLSRVAQCHLLTFGFPPYQQCKVRGITSFRHIFTTEHYTWRHTTKGDVIKKYDSGVDTYFVDDTVSHLEDVRTKTPWVTCVRMEWPKNGMKTHPDDQKKWHVAHSFEELLAYVQKGRS
jgi:FMN phosphatase YigB (HAD superfamily)